LSEKIPPPPLPLAEAQARLLASANPLGSMALNAEAALGYWLAASLQARRTQPSADLSAMDGFAMKAGESGPWKVIGESAAGHPFAGIVSTGEAIRISTGALMPEGADAVLLQENALREGDLVILNGEGDPTVRHIRRAGFDFAEGQEVLPSGTRIGPAQLALAISSGHAELEIHRRANLAIIDCGDELAADPRFCEAHQIPASNGAMLAGMASGLAGTIRRIGPVADDMAALASALSEAGDADVIVTSGGASVGDHDLVRPALEAWGADIAFWRVAMKPGKPLLVARKGSQFVLGLPGNPVSSYVTAFLFLLPLLRKLGGSRRPLPQTLSLPLGADVPAGGNRLEFLRAIVEQGVVTPVNEQDSSALRSLSSANTLIERPSGASAASAGTPVPIYLLENGGNA
jgi:molybdopterin molybdotransferase